MHFTKETEAEETIPKTKGVAPDRTFADVARNRIIIGVMDEKDSEGKILRAQ